MPHLIRKLRAVALMALCASGAMAQNVSLSDFEDQLVGPAGTASAYVQGTGVTTTNTRVVDSGAVQGANAFAFEFQTGAATSGVNLSQCNFGMTGTLIPASGVNALRFSVKAPAGTVFGLTAVLSNNQVWEAKRQVQTLNNQWQTFIIPLANMVALPNSAGTDLAALNSAGVTTSWGALLIWGDGDGYGTANLSGTFMLDDFRLVQSPDVTVFDFENYGPSAWGVSNTYQPEGATAVTTNSRIVVTQRAEGLRAFAIDYTTGVGEGLLNYSQSTVWMDPVPYPAAGVNAFRLQARGVAGTTFRLTLVQSDAVARETPNITLTTTNQWETFVISFNDFIPAITEADLAAMNLANTKIDWIALKVYGADFGLANSNSTLYLDYWRLVNYIAPSAARNGWELY